MNATTHSVEKNEFHSTRCEKRIPETRLARVEPVPMYIESYSRAGWPSPPRWTLPARPKGPGCRWQLACHLSRCLSRCTSGYIGTRRDTSGVRFTQDRPSCKKLHPEPRRRSAVVDFKATTWPCHSKLRQIAPQTPAAPHLFICVEDPPPRTLLSRPTGIPRLSTLYCATVLLSRPKGAGPSFRASPPVYHATLGQLQNRLVVSPHSDASTRP